MSQTMRAWVFNMKPPCELVVNKILPNIRAEIAKILIEEYKMKQTEVAKILGITQGSISLYTTFTRAKDKKILRSFPEIKRDTEDIAEEIATGKLKNTPLMLCSICKKIRKNKNFCKYYKQFAQLTKCKICDMISEG